MSRKIIINADDYGRTLEVSRGIREAHQRGIVTSTTCMMNLPTTAADIQQALKDTPTLGLGVHLVLTTDTPCLPPAAVRSLTDEAGHFLKLKVLMARLPALDLAEVQAEWRAQIEAFVRAAHRPPTHLDSHHHASYFTPALFRAMLELAREYGCAIRLPVRSKSAPQAFKEMPEPLASALLAAFPGLMRDFSPRSPDGFLTAFYGEGATPENLRACLFAPESGVYEIMCHPGYVDAPLTQISSYLSREAELHALTDPKLKPELQARGVQLIHFGEL